MATLIGTGLPDYLTLDYGTSDDDFVSGGAGNDHLRNESDGNDTLIGGTGDDDLYSWGAGTKTYFFSIGDGADSLYNIDNDGYSNEDTVEFRNVAVGDVTLSHNGIVLLIDYGIGDRLSLIDNDSVSLSFADGVKVSKVILGTEADDELWGAYDFGRSSTEGNDLIDGLAGADRMGGSSGDDVYFVDNAGDLVEERENEGNDTVVSAIDYTLGANVENLTLRGASAINGTGNDVANILTGNSVVNTLTGGAGSDTYVVQNTADLVVENAGEGTDWVKSTVTYVLSANVEKLTLTGASAINGTGNVLNNVIVGNFASNQLNGQIGADTMIGGDGSDRYYVDHAGDVVTERNATASTGGTDTVFSSLAAYTLGANVENGNIRITGAANLTGNSLANALYAGNGNNVLNGGAGTDTVDYANAGSAVRVSLAIATGQATGGSGTDTLTAIENLSGSAYGDKLTGNSAANVLNGAAGADTLTGGDGSDTYYVDNAGDMVSETNATASIGGTDTVYSSLAAYTLGANVEHGRILSAGAANLTGNGLANTLYAGSGNNVLNGGAGTDTVSYAYASSAVTVSLAIATGQATGGSGTDTLTAIENLSGSAYGDKLTGNSANNMLNGGAGNDVLTGGSGKDILTGGAGVDRFDFNALSEMGLTSGTRDVITDFVRGIDKIDLSTLDANTATASNNAFTGFIGSGAAFTAAGQLKFVGGVLYGNTDADASAEFTIQLTGITTLSIGDVSM